MRSSDLLAGMRCAVTRRGALGAVAVPSIIAFVGGFRVAARVENAAVERTAMWIPFRIDRLRLIEIDIRINGARASAVLDTGATRTALDRSFAARVGIAVREGFRGNGLTGALAGGLLKDVVIEIGERPLPALDAAVLDLSDISAALGRQVDLVLGQEMFRESLVEIDFPCNRLRLQASGTQVDYSAPLSLGATSDRLRTLPVELAGEVAAQAALDLGSNVPLYVSPALAERHRLLDQLPTSTSASAGAEGIETSEIAVLPSLTIAGTKLDNVPVQIPRRWRFASDVLVGLPILSRFRLALDFSHSRAWLDPEESLITEPFPKDRSGLGAIAGRGHLRVIHVASGSPAERSGLVAGDEIIAVNGRIVDDAFLRSRSRIGQGSAGTEVVLDLSNGVTHRLVLEDYF